MEFIDLIEKRFSARSYTRDDVAEESIERILSIIDTAPSAGNLQSFRVAVVRDPNKRSALAQASGQSWMKSAPVFLAFFADIDQFGRRYGKIHVDTMPLQDATIAMTFAHLAATELGLGSCWIGTFARDEAQDICGIKGNLQFAGILILGKTDARMPRRNRRGPGAWAHKM